MSPAFERQTVSFVIRLWLEPGQKQDESQWRGQIEHIGSGATAYFQVPVELLQFLASCVPAPSTTVAGERP